MILMLLQATSGENDELVLVGEETVLTMEVCISFVTTPSHEDASMVGAFYRDVELHSIDASGAVMWEPPILAVDSYGRVRETALEYPNARAMCGYRNQGFVRFMVPKMVFSYPVTTPGALYGAKVSYGHVEAVL